MNGHEGLVVWPPHFPDHNPLGFFFRGHMKSLAYEALLALRISWQGMSSLQLTSSAHQNCLNASDNPLSVGIGCAISYVAAITNNSRPAEGERSACPGPNVWRGYARTGLGEFACSA
ncbi:hypothetical protein TNCV_3527201 [Trichonephila clavipes]|nr:hypothetical protein TNCV_3527201 [Trichonephila clavipes]